MAPVYGLAENSLALAFPPLGRPPVVDVIDRETFQRSGRAVPISQTSPDSPNVLVASRLLNAGESTLVTFDAPTEPGEYPFVCSFPGHWVTMRGVLRIE